MQHLTDLVTQLEGALITGFAAWLVAYGTGWLRAHTKWMSAETQQATADLLSDVVNRGAKLASSGLATETLKVGTLAYKTGNPQVDFAAEYVAQHSPDLLKSVGIDITTSEGQQALARRVIATLPPAPK